MFIDDNKFHEAFNAAHLYYQQHVIDDSKISYEEFRSRIDPFDIAGIMEKYSVELETLTYEKEVLQRALDLINNTI
jgi:hypothetical protein